MRMMGNLQCGCWWSKEGEGGGLTPPKKRRLRMSSGRNLMLPDDFKNLGFTEEEEAVPIPGHAGGATKSSRRDDGKKIT